MEDIKDGGNANNTLMSTGTTRLWPVLSFVKREIPKKD